MGNCGCGHSVSVFYRKLEGIPQFAGYKAGAILLNRQHGEANGEGQQNGGDHLAMERMGGMKG